MAMGVAMDSGLLKLNSTLQEIKMLLLSAWTAYGRVGICCYFAHAN